MVADQHEHYFIEGFGNDYLLFFIWHDLMQVDNV
jgi:hypothetical protein